MAKLGYDITYVPYGEAIEARIQEFYCPDG